MEVSDKGALDLEAPFSKDTLLEVRASKMKLMKGLSIQTGIDKTPLEGPVHVSHLGLAGDEHDPTFHGGPEKAIHQYCSSHYPAWRREYPSAADRFRPGGFGENFVARQMNERNVCIGDVVSVGAEVLLQVCLPRQPCFKLNHRFELKNFAPKTFQSSRTGWYYRVLREGTVQAGDEIRLEERRHPKWTIERVQEYLHRRQDNHDMNEELAAIEELGEESRGAFRKRVAKHKAAQLRGTSSDADVWRDFRIIERTRQTPRIVSFALEAVIPDPDAERLMPGAHTRIRLPTGLVRSYSVVSGDRNRFELGIALEEHGRGGSRYLHESTHVGDTIKVSRFTTDVKIASAASNHVFIAGGIGITAFLDLMQAYARIHYNFTLHYAVRDAGDVPFRSRVDALGPSNSNTSGGCSGNVIVYDGSKGERMDIPHIVRSLGWNSHLYVCGPARMMAAVRAAAAESGLGDGEVHYEAFEADTSGDPFEVEVLNRGAKVLAVGGEETLLEVLRRQFGEDSVASSCEVGNCGTCIVKLCRGDVDHRGAALSSEEKETTMLSCVSRGIGRIAIEF